MPSLIKKMKKGKPYYYIVESKRINGKPRIVNQFYLGSAASILKTHQSKSAPAAKEVALTRFGPMAFWDVAISLGLPQMIDEAFPKRKQGPPMSKYLLLAAMGRAFSPCSKVEVGKWYEATALKRVWGVKTESFSSQDFWNAMDRINLERLTKLERDISIRICEHEKLAPKALLYDSTNYFTFVDTLNERNTEALRGRNKQGRHNLRQLGLAVAVTPDFHIPLFHVLYPGNINDITQFKAIYGDLVDRIEDLAGASKDLTLVFDKGNMSEEILYYIEDQKLFIVGSAPASSHSELEKIGLDKFEEADVNRLGGVQAWRGQKEIAGQAWTVVISHSASFAAAQYQSLATSQAKAIIKLDVLSKTLRRGERPKATVKTIKKKVSEILARQHMKTIIKVEVFEKNDRTQLKYCLDQDALKHLMDYQLGRTVLISNRHEWDATDIILAYRNQSEVEQVFKETKNSKHLAFRPTYHWTDQKLHVHAFYCIIASALTGILRKRLAGKGIHMPAIRLLEELNNISEATLLYPPDKKGPPRLAFSKVRQNNTQKQLFKALELSKYLRPEKKS